MGTHISKVKSVDLDIWTPEQMAVSLFRLILCFYVLIPFDSPSKNGAMREPIFTGKPTLSQDISRQNSMYHRGFFATCGDHPF